MTQNPLNNNSQMYVLLQVLKLKSRGFWIVMLKWGTCLSRIGNSIGRETKDRGQVPAHCVYFLISPPWFLPMGLNLNLVIAFCLGHAPFRAQIRACWFGAQATPEQSEPCHFDTALHCSSRLWCLSSSLTKLWMLYFSPLPL